MALGRKMLEAMGIEAAKIEQIIDMHAETVDALKKQRDAFKADADKLPELQKQLEELNKVEPDKYKEKYEAEHDAFEQFKAHVAKEKADAEKSKLYRELLKLSGVDEKRIDTVMKVTDLDAIEVENGAIKDADKLENSIKEEWADFVTTTTTEGAKVQTPPQQHGQEIDYENMTMEEYISARSKS